MTHDMLELLVGAVCGGSGLIAFVQWWVEHRRKPMEDTLKRVETTVNENTQRLDTIEQSMLKHHEDAAAHQQMVRRRFLFTEPSSRIEHEDLLDIGKRYLQDGGNGAGHVRYEHLQADYEQRLKNNNWEYK